jgi:aryl-alcohol dehydrogenase-like predicted oxidoreductase
MNLSGRTRLHPGAVNDRMKNTSASDAGNVSLDDELSVHRLGFGAMRLTGVGIWGPPKDKEGAPSVLRRAVALGVNFVDTADSYGPDVNEQLIKEALYPYPEGLVIATKGGWKRPGPGQWTHDATPPHLRKAVESSLRKLRRDTIDLYYLHIPDPIVSFDVSLDTLAQLRGEGKIRLVGLSNVTQEHIKRARKIVPIVSVQNRYSFADREWDYVVDYCARNEIAFVPWFPLGAGETGCRGAKPSRERATQETHAGGACMAVTAFADHVADSGDVLYRTSRGKYGSVFSATDGRAIPRTCACSRIGRLAMSNIWLIELAFSEA